MSDAPPISETAAPVTGADVPLRRQFLQIKARYPDTVLFFRLGDFYETFDRDAEIAADVLDIVLTGREMGKGQRVPMAGIPYHAAESYIGRLISAGHKVAICEQIGRVSKGRELVERDVTRVVTPGTVVDASMLDERANNYIAAVVFDNARAGIAYADITTGEFATTELSGGGDAGVALAAGREIFRLGAVECVVPVGLPDHGPLALSTWAPTAVSHSQTEVWCWRLDRAEETLRHHFAVESLDGFGCAGKPLAIRAAGGLLQYLQQTRLSGLDQNTALSTYAIDNFMTLDAQTRRNLELTESSRGDKRHSLVGVLDRAKTPMGARLLRRWLSQPLLDLEALRTRQDGVAHFHADTVARSTFRQALGSVGDMERLVNRAVAGIATPRDMGQLRASLAAIPAVTTAAGDVPGLPSMPSVTDTHDLLSASLVDEPPAILGKVPTLRPGFTNELDSHRARAQEARAWIAGLERSERERTGIKSLKVGYNKVFGYYLEITTAALATAERDLATNGRASESVLPQEYIPKQMLSNGTRYFTPELKEFETVVLTAQETLTGIEADAFRRVCRTVAAAAPTLLAVAQAVAYLDLIAALADVAVERGYVRPELDDSGLIEIEAGRHPVLETVLGRGEYVPNDAHLDPDGAQIIILTGPNMAGKSSWLRQVALIT
ncbi:MAG: DNA mismatch repair protein MutS, partial [Chloroflexota bacterium]|nr:DNA mismatch repair protein MutS [Chloroflexota bacterium]